MSPGKHILVVEDDPDNSDLIAYVLRSSGCQVTATTTMSEALALARGGNFDLILLDGRLPDGSGVDLLGKLRTFNQRTPAVIVSADAYPADRERGMAAGAQAYLIKPCSPDDLQMVVALLLTE